MPDTERHGPPEPPQVPRALRLTTLQRIGLPVLFAIPILALFGVFGEHFATAHAEGAGLAITMRYPDRAHYRQPVSFRLSMRNVSSQPLDTITVTLDTAFMRAFSDVSVSAPLNGAYVARITHLAPGETRAISATVSGERYGRHAGVITVAGSHGTARLPVATFVFP
jgi:hypothetical protein